MVLLGAHVSVAGGVANGPVNGAGLGCDTIQIFSKNQRQWVAKPLEAAQARAFRQAMADHRLKGSLIHDSYLINLASPKAELLAKSRRAFVDEMERAEALQVSGLVFHPGSHSGSGEEQGLAAIAASLDWCVEQAGTSVDLLLETTAGQGTNLGYTFGQLAAIIDRAATATKARLGVCFDTCHTFAAGYDTTTAAGYVATFEEFDRLIGLDRLKAFHLNDSLRPLNSRRDRHAGIGLAEMGLEPFRLLVNDDRFANLPAVLEVPGGDEAYTRDLATLRGLKQ